jgi:hypothetical protein
MRAEYSYDISERGVANGHYSLVYVQLLILVCEAAYLPLRAAAAARGAMASQRVMVASIDIG